jgi:hypothetical protein
VYVSPRCVQVPPLGWNSTVFCGGGRFVEDEVDDEEEPDAEIVMKVTPWLNVAPLSL